ncbi:MAG: 23S rRNA (adenine(2503)-C(2))-methyltransferase RlmN [Clostridia bacterium]|nr:23S rRNA (adenine(2503)-C(2))-methyltransferase RlmN [Clostridia bacterium]
MKILQDLSYEKLKELISSLGEKPFRVGQIFRALHSGRKISEITELSSAFREKLLTEYVDEPVKIIKKLVSKDGTEKYLFALHDGNVVEGVFMKNSYGNTECLSTQVGCRMGCKFCASGIGGLVRNLTAGEMVATVSAVNRINGGSLDKRAVTNIVLMGSGEPFDNYDNVVEFLKILNDKNGLNVSMRNISLSTCGLVPQMKKFASEGLPLNLTVSLHNPFNDQRSELMPIAKAYSIDEILSACDYYFDKTGRRFIFEYSLVLGVNDSDKHANELIRLLKSRPCHVNIIRLNEVKENGLKATDDKSAYRFADKLTKGGVSATVRRLFGADIEGACGQLRRTFIESEKL